MGLLERINELGLNNTDKVTILADGDYVIFEEKNEKCLGIYKVYDTRGYEVLFRATELTKQDIISVSELKELAKGFVINTSVNTCQMFQDCTNSKAKYITGVTGDSNCILGKNNDAIGRGSIIIGDTCQTDGDYSTAIGTQCRTIGVSSLALGTGAVARGMNSTAVHSIQVIEDYAFGSLGPIYGHELYSNQFEVSGNPLTKQFLLDISNLNVYNSTTEYYYTISGNSIPKNYFKSKMVASKYGDVINAVNITQLVYTLVGAVKDLKQLTDNQQTTIQDLTSRLNTLEST